MVHVHLHFLCMIRFFRSDMTLGKAKKNSPESSSGPMVDAFSTFSGFPSWWNIVWTMFQNEAQFIRWWFQNISWIFNFTWWDDPIWLILKPPTRQVFRNPTNRALYHFRKHGIAVKWHFSRKAILIYTPVNANITSLKSPLYSGPKYISIHVTFFQPPTLADERGYLKNFGMSFVNQSAIFESSHLRTFVVMTIAAR